MAWLWIALAVLIAALAAAVLIWHFISGRRCCGGDCSRCNSRKGCRK